MLENWRRRCTRSWNAYTVLLDLGGSLLSTVQLLLVFGLVENSVKPWNGPTPMNLPAGLQGNTYIQGHCE
jgi:hypothetical protein